MEFNEDAPLIQSFKWRKTTQKKKVLRAALKARDPEPGTLAASSEHFPTNAQSKILVSEFDYSVENHFKFVDTMAKLCGYLETLEADQAEIKQFSNSVTFLREWRDFNYKPRVVKFACQNNSEEKDVIGGVTLSQFSAACVPKKETQNGSGIGVEYRDLVMNVGGSVWSLDWCPSVDSDSENNFKSEFVAVAAHPPDSLYHKIGAPLTGRGAIQIWCLLTVNVKDGPSQGNKKSRRNIQKKGTVTSNGLAEMPKPRGRPKKKSLPESLNKVPRPKGRPKKKSQPESPEKIDAANEHPQPLAIEYPIGSPESNSSDRTSGNACKRVNDEDCTRIDNDANRMGHADTLLLTAPRSGVNKRKAGKDNQIHHNSSHYLRHAEHGESAVVPPESAGFCLDSANSDKNATCISSSDANTTKTSIPIDVALPRLMLCLAHNGKVAWDVKWRPVDAYHPESMYIMGYLAVVLGNGVLEVWKVPLPHTVKLAYPASEKHTDPRFIKLQPVFRCSMLKCGDRRSIPLTVEWSVSSPYDKILAGCHDGVVALWNFSVSDSLTETRPLLCFSADTGPIRTLAWAPNPSVLESANIIVTGGQKGSKFWDIRDPFRPLRDHPIPVATYCVDWLSDPRCVFGTAEDGTVWLLSLEKAAHDLPLREKCHYMASQHGFHNFDCSAFSLWSLQASRQTGMVAYCGEDGSTLCFQPTARLLKDPSRNRVHHYLCGSLLEEENAIIVASPLPNSSFQVRFPSMKRSGAGKEQERRAKEQIHKNQSVNDQTLGDVEKLNEGIGREERGEEFEVFPPKVVAMHRVRWNVNKGRDKWLCYGGAAGLVRCQEVDFLQFPLI